METVVRLFHEAECDVLMHWQAGTDIMNYFLPFLPLAPVQCIGFGNHGTTGIGNIDYFVSSQLFERGHDAHQDYTETLVQFPGTTAWQSRPPLPPPAMRSDFGLPHAGTLYFCPQRQAKLHPGFDPILNRILAEDPSGHVVFLQGSRPRSARMLQDRFSRTLGDAFPKRIHFVPSLDAEGYYRLLSLMDVVLDTPVYSASLTGYDAFAYGIPIVTMPGRHMVQRYAAGLYERMGVAGPVANSVDEYVRLALQLGQNADARSQIKSEIQERCAVLYQDIGVVEQYNEFFWNVAHK